jgi:membrane fusion protein, multidrug efflux system
MRRLALAGLAIAGLLAAACRRGDEVEAVAGKRAVRCAGVVVATVRDVVEVRGTVAPWPDRDVLLAPQVAGRLLKVEVREGDVVAEGAVVARVDDAPLVDAAVQADAAVARARAEHLNAQTSLARTRHVFEQGIAARQEVDDAAAREAATAAAVAEADAAARVAHRTTARAWVRSPLAGVVLKVLRRSGELVDGTPATAVAEVADLTQLELAADVPAQDLLRLQRGQGGTLGFAALPGRSWSVSVARVSPGVDRTTGLGTVRLAILLAEGVGPPVGAFGEARLAAGEPRPGTLVPVAAVRSGAGATPEVVVCGDDGRAHVRAVRVAPGLEGRLEVQGGLDGGERVAVEPVLGLAEGDALEVAPP